MSVLQKINRVVSWILKLMLIISFGYMTVVLLIQVFGRYLFNTGFTWTEETARYIMIWAVFLGAAFIALNSEHVKVTIVEDAFKSFTKKGITHLTQHCVCLLFGILIMYFGFRQLSIAKLSTSANTGLSMLFPYSVFPVAGILIAYSYFYRVVDTVYSLMNKKGVAGK